MLETHIIFEIRMEELEKPENAFKEYPGPILLLAGPGTGKTFQLAERVKHLIDERRVSPSEIAIITFTNEAARNMRDRLGEIDTKTGEPFLPREKHPETISTMHSMGNAIIGRDPGLFELPSDYAVLHDKYLRNVLLEDAATLAGLDRSTAGLAEECRRKGWDLAAASNDIKEINTEYEKLLRKCSLVDFDDQILLACKALRANKGLRNEWRSRTRYLLIDEYQDINRPQCEMIQILSSGQEDGLFAVGDDDQSIYSFRGGTPEYIREFGKYFGNKSRIGRLTKSRRCPKHILLGAQAVVSSYYSKRVPKPEPTFDTKSEDGGRIVLYDVPSEKKEAKVIAAIAKENIRTASVNVIIPNVNYLLPLKKALLNVGLNFKYRLSLNEKGLVRFSVLADWCRDMKNSAKLRHLIDLIINNHDETTRKLEASTNKITKLRILASEKIACLWKDIPPKLSLHDILEKKYNEPDPDPFLFTLFDNLKSIARLLKEGGGRRQMLPEFLQKCGQFIAPGKNPNSLLAEIEEWQDELMLSTKPAPYKPVYIYNMPSSKGLEADIVCVVGVTKDIIPSTGGDVEEQARLFYVAMTRAKKTLYLFSARTRSGNVTFVSDSYQLEKSPFVDVIPREHIENRYIPADYKRSKQA